MQTGWGVMHCGADLAAEVAILRAQQLHLVLQRDHHRLLGIHLRSPHIPAVLLAGMGQLSCGQSNTLVRAALALS